jgi:phospholipid transport system substrate-binding protein
MRNLLASIAGLVLMVTIPASIAMTPGADAQMVIKETSDKVLSTLRMEGEQLKSNPARLYKLIDELILPHFDFQQMSRWVLGRYWHRATPQQRSEFVTQFQALLVRTYSQALVDYRDQNVNFLPVRERSPDEVTVRAEIDQGAGPKIPMVYEMSRTDGGWKVYDVAVGGVSLVINYRSTFAQEIKRNGIEGLIRRLKEKNTAANG